MPLDAEDVDAVALLDEPVRRSLYEWVALQGRAVGRDEAAAAVGIARSLAAFHLDRLVREGLLLTEYRRLTGRSGPGAGRPSKLYRRAPREVHVSLPDRHYDVAAELLAEAIEGMGEALPPEALRTSARRMGNDLGRAARRRAGARPSRARLRASLCESLRSRGYEPQDAGTSGEIRLGNCPFHSLVAEHRDLVCGMNLALADGLVEGLGDGRLAARSDPGPDRCCVAIAPVGPR